MQTPGEGEGIFLEQKASKSSMKFQRSASASPHLGRENFARLFKWLYRLSFHHRRRVHSPNRPLIRSFLARLAVLRAPDSVHLFHHHPRKPSNEAALCATPTTATTTTTPGNGPLVGPNTASTPSNRPNTPYNNIDANRPCV
ncbi:uncharacterized protein ARMOST_07131 [Armillaria ostoyae]|uniref:Uncharacterized protein n=1 Tax=Armillaria ostoyae TaxID=47428 RepID=A0A284R4Z0_ARMOS|nr:uncharacterized protein ARMOST_07131 [Armillaria ostoyae]